MGKPSSRSPIRTPFALAASLLLAAALLACAAPASSPAPAQGRAPPRPAPAAAAPAAPAPTAAPPPEVFRIAYSAIAGSHLPIWIAKDAGFFAREGLDPELIYIAGGSAVIQAMLGGEILLASVAGAAGAVARLQGADIVYIASQTNTMPYVITATPDITDIQQLRGQVVGVTRFGAATDVAMRYALERNGMVPGQDVTLLQMQGLPETFVALQQGHIKAAALQPPETLRGKQLNLNPLVDLVSLGLTYQHVGMATREQFLQERPDTIRRFLRAYLQGIHYMKTQRAESQAIAGRYMNTTDQAELDEMYETYGLKYIQRKPYPLPEGMKTVLETDARSIDGAATADPRSFLNTTLLRELDDSGFIDRLYGDR